MRQRKVGSGFGRVGPLEAGCHYDRPVRRSDRGVIYHGLGFGLGLRRRQTARKGGRWKETGFFWHVWILLLGLAPAGLGTAVRLSPVTRPQVIPGVVSPRSGGGSLCQPAGSLMIAVVDLGIGSSGSCDDGHYWM